MKTPARPALLPVTASAFFLALGLACAAFSAQAQTIVAPLFDEPGDIAPVIAPVTKAELKARRQFDMLDEDVAILGETLSLFVQFWLTMTPPLSDSAKQSARIKGNERFEGFMQTLGKRLASGDRFLKELSRDMDSLHDLSSQGQSEADGNQL